MANKSSATFYANQHMSPGRLLVDEKFSESEELSVYNLIL